MTTVLHQLEEFSAWVAELRDLSDERWLEPLAIGKWSVAECVAHLLFWEWYALEHHLPLIGAGARLSAPPEAQTLNDRAAFYATSGISKTRLLEDFCTARRALLTKVRALTALEPDDVFFIGERSLTLHTYLLELLQHNAHHQAQIAQCLEQASAQADLTHTQVHPAL